MTRDERKDTERAYQSAYRIANHDRLLIQRRKWRAANLARLRAYAQARRDKFRVAHRHKHTERAAVYRAQHPERARAAWRKHAAAHPDKRLASVKAYQARNPDKVSERYRQWALANPEIAAAKRLRRMLAEKQSIPTWADHAAIKAVYIEAARMTRETGIRHNVDHIVPLRGRGVCGLHVHWNIRVITQSDNCRKSNKFPVSLAS